MRLWRCETGRKAARPQKLRAVLRRPARLPSSESVCGSLLWGFRMRLHRAAKERLPRVADANVLGPFRTFKKRGFPTGRVGPLQSCRPLAELADPDTARSSTRHRLRYPRPLARMRYTGAGAWSWRLKLYEFT